MTDRLRCILPPPAVDVYYSPSIDRTVLTGVDGYASGALYARWPPIPEVVLRRYQPHPGGQWERSALHLRARVPGHALLLERTLWLYYLAHGHRPLHLVGNPAVGGVGPCGPRAVSVTNDFLLFVHRSGVYLYTQGAAQPELITKELPNIPGGFWSTINWDAQEAVCCFADEENKEVRVLLPVGASLVPNVSLTLNYGRGGWTDPLLSLYRQGDCDGVTGARSGAWTTLRALWV